MLPNRKTQVISLPEKNIEGAINYLSTERLTLKPKAVILQVISNSLLIHTAEVCMFKTNQLVNMCATKFPGAKIFIACPLPRKLGSAAQTDVYMTRMKNVCHLLASSSLNVINFTPLQNYSDNFYNSDGVHLNPRGIGVVVKYYKSKISDTLGLNYSLHNNNQSSNYNHNNFQRTNNHNYHSNPTGNGNYNGNYNRSTYQQHQRPYRQPYNTGNHTADQSRPEDNMINTLRALITQVMQ